MVFIMPVFCFVQKPLHFGTLESRARNVVVYVLVVNFKASVFGILAQDSPLVVYGYRLALTFVLLGKPVIQSRYVMFLLHNSPRVFCLLYGKSFHRFLEILAAVEIPADEILFSVHALFMAY